MKEVDYIIVGCGLAGIAFSELLIKQQKSFLVFDDGSQHSSTVAAGMYNPVILKRFTPVWKAAEQLELAIPIYKDIEKRFGITIDYQFDLLRRFTSIEEQNMWFNAADKPRLSAYIDLNLVENENRLVDAPYGFGKVNEAGRVNTELLVSEYQKHLSHKGLLVNEPFCYEMLMHSEGGVVYGGIETKQIIFSEGYGIKRNPFFKDVPLNGTKGEVLTLKIKGLNLKDPIKSGVFIIPLGHDLYKVGATYNHKDKTNAPTIEARKELLQKLENFIKIPYEIIDHKVGIRPTTKDRRPIVGRHPEYRNLYVLNGLGSRGVMIAPYVAQQLFELIEGGSELEAEINLNRFD